MEASVTLIDAEAPERSADNEDVPLSRLVRVGLQWSFVSNILSKLSTLVSGIVLARLLAPSDYGHFTVAVVALVVIASINDLGLEPSIVRWPGSIESVAPTAVTLIFGMSCLLYVGCFVGAPAFAQALNDPSATAMVRVLGLGLITNGMFAVPSAQLTRAFDQRRRTIADLTGFFVSLGLTIVLAVLGFGAWSLVWGRLIGNGLNSVLHFVFVDVRYRPGWSPRAARELTRSGLPLAGATLLTVGMLNLDYVIVGRVLGPTELGFYLMAFNLSSWPVTMFSVAMARVSVASFGRVQHDPAAVRAQFTRYLGGLMALTIPVAVLLCVLALPLVRVVYGSEWDAAAIALHFLVVVGVARVALQLANDLLVGVGNGSATFRLQGLWFAVALPALAVGAHVDGIRGVGIAHMVVALLVVTPAFLVVLRRFGVTPADAAGAIARPALGGLLAAGGAGLALFAFSSAFVQLAVGGTIGVVVYALVVIPRYADLRSRSAVAAVAS